MCSGVSMTVVNTEGFVRCVPDELATLPVNLESSDGAALLLLSSDGSEKASSASVLTMSAFSGPHKKKNVHTCKFPIELAFSIPCFC